MCKVLLAYGYDEWEQLAQALTSAGHSVTAARDGPGAFAALSKDAFDVAVLDAQLPKVDGWAVLQHLRKSSPDTHAIVVTAAPSIPEAVSALRDHGAVDYLQKPLDAGDVLGRIAKLPIRSPLLATHSDSSRVVTLAVGTTATVVGESLAIRRVLEKVASIAHSNAPVLITGASGTGKELIAHMLHESGTRRGRPFVAINCAAFPETLLEAELFGYEKGAFTGAVRRRDGRFRAADTGTLLLDEIAEMPLQVQAKLLRVLQDGTIEPLGTNQSFHVDVRLVSATHRNLRERIAQGLFREDLYYRIKVLGIEMPSLSDRREDLPLLLAHYLRCFSRAGHPPPTISARAWAALLGYGYPGNVREFAHAIEHAVVLAGDHEIDLQHLPVEIAGTAVAAAVPNEAGLLPLRVATLAFEREYLTRALALTDGRRARAAANLGISRRNLWSKLRQHKLAVDETDDETDDQPPNS